MSKEAMRLSAIFNLAEEIYKEKKVIPWTEAIEEALDQSHSDVKQEQRSVSEHTGEPVAWVHAGALETMINAGEGYAHVYPSKQVGASTPLYTTPPQGEARGLSQQQRKPLTDEQIEAIHQSTWMQSTATLNDFARAIEAAHGIKEKNT